MFNPNNFFTFHIILIVLTLISYFVLTRLLIKDKNYLRAHKDKIMNLHLIGAFFLMTLWMFISMTPQIFIQILLNNVVNVAVLALATTGIVLIFKTSITTNFAQGMIATVGAFMSARIITSLGDPNNLDIGVFLLAILGGVITSFIIGLLVDVFILRKSKYITSIGKQMITMGLVLVLMGAMPLFFNVINSPIPRLDFDIARFNFLGMALTMSMHAIYTLIITVFVLALLFIALNFTKWGLGVRATASNEVVASMMGVNTKMITAMSWAIAGGLGAIAAILYTPGQGIVSVGLMVPIQVNGFMASILGGFSTFTGPLIGAIMIPWLSALFSYYNSLWQGVIVYTLILLIVLVKPLGLFGKKIAKKV
ncbi:MAG: branched-chain amino acid ABC transporter permease [Tenericutes bacterium HGW-Tenericutes-6]|nr:MAG: branched-chain amino acid ABC transporter permease [Tenericutes bacterium HGW-Tenericutes-6]